MGRVTHLLQASLEIMGILIHLPCRVAVRTEMNCRHMCACVCTCEHVCVCLSGTLTSAGCYYFIFV